MPLPRQLLRTLAESRIREAGVLLDARHPGGAHYLAGYAVELGLKACIAAQFRADEIPDWAISRDFLRDGHNLSKLLQVANLTAHHDAEMERSEAFERNWRSVLTWRPDSRYEATATQALAEQLVRAVDDLDDGVLAWIRTHW